MENKKQVEIETEVALKMNALHIEMHDVQRNVGIWKDKLHDVEDVDRENYEKYIEKGEKEIENLKTKLEEIQEEIKTKNLFQPITAIPEGIPENSSLGKIYKSYLK